MLSAGATPVTRRGLLRPPGPVRLGRCNSDAAHPFKTTLKTNSDDLNWPAAPGDAAGFFISLTRANVGCDRATIFINRDDG